jgi:hypothetical protein
LAADRIREITGKPASTIHSFLAGRSWLNPNYTFKRSGGRKEEEFQTYIIDEASMLNLELAAAFIRSVNWVSVQRLIFVGEPALRRAERGPLASKSPQLPDRAECAGKKRRHFSDKLL